MAQTGEETAPQFSQPIRQIMLMLIVLALSGLGGVMAAPTVKSIFLSNLYLNGFIAFVFVVGVLSCFWQVVQLVASVRWIEEFAGGLIETGTSAPRLLTPLATLLGGRRRQGRISSSSATSILESVVTRIDEAREITRYITALLIFLGLLGTFYGLATTVPALVDTIRSLAPQDGESGTQIFARLMTGLQGQLSGMGTAFSSSLLGLTGSLIVGLLELFVGHGQNRFYRELEEWLSTITRLGFAEGEGGDHSALVTVLDNMGEQMEAMQGLFARAEQGRAEVDQKLSSLADTIERLTDRMAEQNAVTGPIAEALGRIAHGQEVLTRHIASDQADGFDAESRMRLRNMDVQLLRILEELSAGRQETMAELRGEISALRSAVTGQPAPAFRVQDRED